MTSTKMQWRLEKLRRDVQNLLDEAVKDLPAEVEIRIVRCHPWKVTVDGSMTAKAAKDE